MSTLAFDPTSITNRILATITAKLEADGLTNVKFFYFGPTRRLIEAFAEEEANAMLYDEYLTRESSWNIALNISSIISKTRFFSYKPHRDISARGQLKVSSSPTFSGAWPRSIQIPRWNTFSNGAKTYICTGNSGSAYLLDPLSAYIYIDVVEGTPQSLTFEITSAAYPSGTAYATLLISDAAVENTMYDVLVNGVLWTEVDDLRLAAGGTSQVYATRNSLDFASVEVMFGNDVFGKSLNIGDVVTIRYARSSGSGGNVIDVSNVTQVVDSYVDSALQSVTLYCTNDSAIDGGQDIEDIESIRVNAPYSYQAGNRAITKDDYQVLIEKSGIVQYVSAWGEAETNSDAGNPAGTYIPTNENLVYLSAFNVDPVSGQGIMATSSQQTAIRSLLNSIKGLTDIVQFVESDFVYLIFSSTVYVSDTRYSLSSVKDSVTAALTAAYSLGQLGYKTNLYRSQYEALISSVAGVDHHVTAVSSLAKIVSLASAYALTLNLGINSVLPGSLTLYVKGGEYAAWTALASDVGALPTDTSHALVAAAGFAISGAAITYATGAIGNLAIISGLAQDYTLYSIKAVFSLAASEGGDIKLTSRTQMIALLETNITPVQM